ncbi:MAG TPA: monofunctional biosynthetic peptidoglycan transglycosylase, partial [Delftia acidovorans]|nr:monofunctional biosynthetic peptidoglycan transglycosylase [Delftia acidovorans]
GGEGGEGLLGAEAPARHYFRKSASQLSAAEAARLAVMLPQPKRFEKLPNSGYLLQRTRTVMQRMPSAVIP